MAGKPIGPPEGFYSNANYSTEQLTGESGLEGHEMHFLKYFQFCFLQ